jgi:hypothetical protein
MARLPGLLDTDARLSESRRRVRRSPWRPRRPQVALVGIHLFRAASGGRKGVGVPSSRTGRVDYWIVGPSLALGMRCCSRLPRFPASLLSRYSCSLCRTGVMQRTTRLGSCAINRCALDTSCGTLPGDWHGSGSCAAGRLPLDNFVAGNILCDRSVCSPS